MRPRVSGMNETDDAILEFFQSLGTPDGEPVTMTPTLAYENIVEIRGKLDKSQSTVARRMKHELLPRGLLAVHGETGAHYYLTSKGRRYLSGEIDPDALAKDS